MAEDDPFIGGFVVVALAEAFGGGGAFVIEGHDARGNEFGVEAVSDGLGAGGGEDEQDTIDVLAAVEGDGAQAESGGDCDGGPEKVAQDLHGMSVLNGDRGDSPVSKPGP